MFGGWAVQGSHRLRILLQRGPWVWAGRHGWWEDLEKFNCHLKSKWRKEMLQTVSVLRVWACSLAAAFSF